MSERAGDLSGAMKVIAETIVASVQRNFEVGGRPAKWALLKPSTLKKRGSGGGPPVGVASTAVLGEGRPGPEAVDLSWSLDHHKWRRAWGDAFTRMRTPPGAVRPGSAPA